jgi:hypothetical protein
VRRQRAAEDRERVAKEDIHVRWADWLGIVELADKARTARAARVQKEAAHLDHALAKMPLGMSLGDLVAGEQEAPPVAPQARNALLTAVG